jgi:arylsulfatase A-like enzyme
LEGIRDVDWVRAQYAGEVDFVDEQVGRLLQSLKSSGRLDDTLVVFVGDHGESLGENGVWFNHGGDLDESALRVPMIFHWPAGLPAETAAPPLASVTDVSPTIRGLLGMDTAAADGLNVFGNGARPGVLAVCYDRSVNQQERAAGRIERPTHVLGRVWGTSGWLQRATHESRQPRSVGDIPGEDADRLERAMAAIGGSVHRSNQNRGADTVERLKALGYVE